MDESKNFIIIFPVLLKNRYLCIIIIRCKKRMSIDRPSFESLFKAHYQQLYCFARTMVGEEESHDVVESAFEALWNHQADVEMDTVKAYLYRIVRNQCINQLSHQKLQQRYVAYIQQSTSDVTSEDSLAEREERARVVDRVLAAMKPLTREILTDCYVNGKKYKEVAEAREMSVSNVKKHMVAALRIIREMKESK